MFKTKLIEQLKNDNHYIIPKYLLKCQKKLNLDIDSFILLIYLLNIKNNDIFDYKDISKHTDLDKKQIFNSIDLLKNKKLLSIEMVKNEEGILEERLNIDSFYDVAFSIIIDDKKENTSNIYDSFEREFGRTLSPIEYEIINSWLESKISEELIMAALKEAVFNGVNNLRYIDKILYEWNKKGIKKSEDIDKRIKEENDESIETYEYDWLNE